MRTSGLGQLPARRLLKHLALVCTILAALTGCGRHIPKRAAHAAAAIEAVDGRGRHVSLSVAPRRIVSLAPAITEILFSLGLDSRIVADTQWCTYPPAARQLPHIGDYRASVEKVVAQRPDLVVASTSANRQAVDQLEGLGIPVFAVDPRNLAQTYDSIERIGAITGEASAARSVVRGMQERIAAVKRRLTRDPTAPRVLIVVQAQPLMVAGSGNFMDDVVTEAGGVNVARRAGFDFGTYSMERVVVDKPDVILAGKEDAAILRANPTLSTVPAVRRGAVYSVNQDTFSRPGPRLAEGVETVARLLHPKAFAR